MGYVEGSLQTGERILYSTRVSAAIYLRPLFAIILGLLLATAAGTSKTPVFVLLVAAALGLIGLLGLVGAAISRFSTEIAVTDRRVFYKRGLIRRDTTEMQVDRVESVDVAQGVVGRLLSYGTVTIKGTGQTARPIRDVDDPLRLRSVIARIAAG